MPVLRPPIASERLSWTEDGRLRYRLKRPNAYGRSAVEYGPLDFVAKLLPVLPRPRLNVFAFTMDCSHRRPSSEAGSSPRGLPSPGPQSSSPYGASGRD